MDFGPSDKLKLLLGEFGGDAMKMYRETGILLPIGGAEHGYNEVADILTRTVDGVPFEQLYNEIIASIGLLNRSRAPLMERLTFPVTTPYEEIMPITSEDFEEADEFGQPRGIRAGRPWNMGYDLRYFDIGIRYTFRFLGRARAGQIRALNAEALEADVRLQFRTILTRLFDNTTKQVTLEDTSTVTSVYPFYNGATTTLPVAPPSWKSYTFANTHNHFLASGAATVVSGDLDDMYEHIYHHGYTQGADVILLTNRVEAKTIRTFRVSGGAMYDFIPAPGTPDAMFRGNRDTFPPPSDPTGFSGFPGFYGWYGPIALVEEDYIPAGYMVMFASGGVHADRNPIGMREHENEELRGLLLIPEFDRYPLREAFYHHALGSGVRHPGAGVVMKVTAGSYDVPALVMGGPGGR